MATTVAVLEAALHADTKKFDSAMGKSESKMQKLGKVAGVAGLAIAGGLAVAFKVGFDEMVASQKVMAQTAAVIESTGGVANVTAKHVDDLSQQLLELSGVDDELITAGQNVLLTFRDIRNEAGKGNDVFDQATKAALDMSVALGMDLNSAAMMVGKALNDPIKGMTKLQRQGVTFTDAQEKLIRKLAESGDVMGAQKVILKELQTEFGGSAKAAGETLPAQLNKAKEAFADITAALVEQLLPAMTAVLGKVSQWLVLLRENPKLAKAMVIGLGALAAALLAASAAQLALNLAVLANPYVAAAVAIIALGAAIVYLVKKVDFFRQHWQLLLIGLGAFPVLVATVVKAAIRHFDTLKAGFNAVREAARRVWPVIEVMMRMALGPLLVFISAVRTAVSVVQALASAIRSLPDMPSFPDINIPNPFSRIPHGAAGGVVTRPTLSVIGEGGPEAVIPLNRMPGASPLPAMGGGVTIVVQNHGLISSPNQVVNLLRNAVAQWERSNGKAAFG